MEQHYYKQNFNKFSLKELKHYSSNTYFLPTFWFLKLFGKLPVHPVYYPMPTSVKFKDYADLTDRCHEFISPQVKSLTRLGFEVFGYEINEGENDPNFIDSGGCHLFNSAENTVALVSYLNYVKLPGKPDEAVNFTMWAQFKSGRSIRLGNHRLTNFFGDKVLGRKSFVINASSPFQMFPVFEQLLKKHAKNESRIKLDSVIKLKDLFAEQSRIVLEAGIKSRRFILMTDAEVTKMKQEKIAKFNAMREKYQRAATVNL